jgi:hypothetical protein
MNLAQFRKSPSSFPLIVSLLHVLTYSLFFLSLNLQTYESWLHGIPLVPWLILLPKYFPNFLGCFLLFHFSKKKFSRKIIVFYLMAIIFEHFIMSFDVMGDFDENIPKARYFFFFSRLDFPSGHFRYIVNVSVIGAIIHAIKSWYVSRKAC